MFEVWWKDAEKMKYTLSTALLLSLVTVYFAAGSMRVVEASTPTTIEKFRESLRPQLSYRSDSEICEHLRFVTEVATRILKGQPEGEMIKEMLSLKEAPRPGKISSAAQEFGLKLIKASEMLDRLSADKTIEQSVIRECNQRYPK